MCTLSNRSNCVPHDSTTSGPTADIGLAATSFTLQNEQLLTAEEFQAVSKFRAQPHQQGSFRSDCFHRREGRGKGLRSLPFLHQRSSGRASQQCASSVGCLSAYGRHRWLFLTPGTLSHDGIAPQKLHMLNFSLIFLLFISFIKLFWMLQNWYSPGKIITVMRASYGSVAASSPIIQRAFMLLFRHDRAP
jgi:hypothetical protein